MRWPVFEVFCYHKIGFEYFRKYLIFNIKYFISNNSF